MLLPFSYLHMFLLVLCSYSFSLTLFHVFFIFSCPLFLSYLLISSTISMALVCCFVCGSVLGFALCLKIGAILMVVQSRCPQHVYVRAVRTMIDLCSVRVCVCQPIHGDTWCVDDIFRVMRLRSARWVQRASLDGSVFASLGAVSCSAFGVLAVRVEQPSV